MKSSLSRDKNSAKSHVTCTDKAHHPAVNESDLMWREGGAVWTNSLGLSPENAKLGAKFVASGLRGLSVRG